MSKPLIALTEIILPIAVALYFFGWIYTYYWLEYFGGDVSAIDLNIYFIIVYSFSVLSFFLEILWNYIFNIISGFSVLMSIFLIVIIYLLIVRYFRDHASTFISRLASPVVYAMVFVVIITGGYFISREAGIAKAHEIRRNPQQLIYFVLKKNGRPDDPIFDGPFQNWNNGYQLYKITATKDFYIVLWQSSPGEVGWVFEIPRSSVSAAQILMRNDPAVRRDQ
ncbi:hypothetical protein [Inquilinus sp. CAU 1745]|uniref:hypothetical protein n=1 Tax=Inquilinus sp. CAU 1745 TaxID=3140369 RepID=UPI00325A7E63